MKWVRISGEVLDMQEMGDQHLFNAIALLERRLADGFTNEGWFSQEGPWGQAGNKALGIEAALRGLKKERWRRRQR